MAGGTGTRLWPLTRAVSKQLLPLYDKPMVYYPLSVLMLAGMREILLISTPQDLPLFKLLLGDGKSLGLKLSYAEQPKPEGLAQAYQIGAKFVGSDPSCLILGDNFFMGRSWGNYWPQPKRERRGDDFCVSGGGSVVVRVLTFDEQSRITSIEEKPAKPKSHWEIVGFISTMGGRWNSRGD